MDLQELTLNLEENVNAMGHDVELLVDVDVLLGQLVISMTDAEHSGELQSYYPEFSRKLRVFRDVIHRSVENVIENYHEIYTATNKLIEKERENQ